MINRAPLRVYPEYVAQFEDMGAGAIMSALHYEYEANAKGHSKLRIWKQQRWWVAKDHHELTAITGLTSRQLQTAVGKLVKSGRVVVCLMRFNGAPTRHFRVPEFVNLCPRKWREEPDGCVVDSQPNQPLTGDHVKSITKSSIYITARAKAMADKSAEATQKQEQKQELPGVMDVQSIAQVPVKQNSGWMYLMPPVLTEKKSLADLKTIMALKNANHAPVVGKSTVSALSLLWRKRVGTEYGGFQKDLTAKEKGQLKLYLKAAGELAAPALDHALQNWTAFAWRAKAEKGLSSVPEKPVVGFLLAHLEVAVQSIAQPEPVAKSPSVLPKQKVKTAKVPTKAKEQPAGADEIQAMIDELKGL